MSKILRTANIRLSALNIAHQNNDVIGIKKGDTIEYGKEDILRTLEDWSKTKNIKYFLSEHNEDVNNVHFHIVIIFPRNSVCTFATIKNKFPYGLIESCKYSVKSCVQYLVHMNHPDKFQYSWDDVVTNAPDLLESFKIPGKATMDAKTAHIIDKILAGEIKEYEIEKIDPHVYIKSKRKIKDAYDYYIRKCQKNPNRNVNVFVLQGKPGTGKTTFCKVYAENHNKSICFSSASNDPWQDYFQEDIFVYDDFNFDSVKIEDILKGLDPYNSTTSRARYKNRLFLGDTIFICTNIPVTEWYQSAKSDHRKALFRRITCVLDFFEIDNNVACYTINDIVDTGEYSNTVDPLGRVDNVYSKMKLQRKEEGYREFDLSKYITFDKEKKVENFIEFLDTV